MRNLIQRLPADSELSKAIHGEVATWSRTEHLLAMVVDYLARLEWAYASVHTTEDHTVPMPTPIPRPGVQQPEGPPEPTSQDIANFFAS